jgi:hypothetical protein
MKNNYQTTSSTRSKKQISNRALLLVILMMSTFSLKAQVPSYVPTNGLVGWWPFNGNANDESGNGNNGTVNGATLTSDRDGNFNKSYQFDGNNDLINIPNNITFDNTFKSNFTLSFWFSSTNSNASNFDGLISKGWSNNSSFFGWQLGLTPSGLGFQTKNPDCGGNITNVINNTWYQVIQVYSISSGFIDVYINGILVSTITTCSPTVSQISSTFDLNFGVEREGNLFYNGKLDDIGIWNRALTQQEITALYNGCQLSINSQPTNQNITVNNNAQFIVNSSDPNATYQWQTDLGVGFQNLSSVGQYSGANNDTLTVSYVTFANNNQPFRCIINSGSCSDTSNVAVLTVNNNVGINEISNNNLFAIYPNPANAIINIKSDAQLIGKSYFIFDNLGKTILTGKITSENMSIDVNNLSEGNYLIGIDDNSKKQSFKVIKN